MAAARGADVGLRANTGRKSAHLGTSAHSQQLTFVRRIEPGFDFLGYHFGPEGLTVAAKTIERFVAHAIRLYEREPGEACASARLGSYVQRWIRWAGAGVPNVITERGDYPLSRPGQVGVILATLRLLRRATRRRGNP